MAAGPPEARRLMALASACLGLVLVVVVVSVAIRLGQAATPSLAAGELLALRAVHRTAASLEVLAMLWLAGLAWRARFERPAFARGAALAGALTLALSVLGIAAGQNPPAAAALGNLLGGLGLAAVFAWLIGDLRPSAATAPALAVRLGGAMLAVQCLLGAGLSLYGPALASQAMLPAHAMIGVVLAAGAAWLAPRGGPPVARAAGVALALAVPVAGFTALQYEFSPAAAFAHAAAAALLVIAAACARPRIA